MRFAVTSGRFRLTLFVIAVVALSLPSLSNAAFFKGTSDQGRRVKLVTTESGAPSFFDIRWVADCVRGKSFKEATGTIPPFDFRNSKRFRDVGSYRPDDRGPFSFTAHANTTARRVSKTMWVGEFNATVHVRKHGRRYTTCKLGRTDWRVHLRAKGGN
jgi:hypothetical protein